MAERRNTYTAILFLIALLTAVVFLLLGIAPSQGGFLDGVRPKRHTEREVKTKLVLPERQPRPDETRDRASRKDEHDEPARRTYTLSIRGHVTEEVTLEDVYSAVTDFINGADPAIRELLDRDHTFIELYGGVQRLLGRRVVEDPDPRYAVVKLTDNLFTFASLEGGQVDMTRRANEMLRFARRVKEEFKVPVLYVQAPSKLDVASLPDGMADYADAEADQFLSLLKRGKLDVLDLRPVFRDRAEAAPEEAETLFFRTDHHWTPAGAFLGYQTLCEKLNERPYRFKIDEALTDPDGFEVYAFKDVFLGSQGRRVGTLYAGVDHFEIWSPKFSTDFTYSVPLIGVNREGPFVTSLLFPERLTETGYYDTNPYTIYAGGDYLLARAVNKNNPDGKRVLVLRDSFGCALTPFLSLACREVMTIAPRNFNGDQDTMMDFIDWLEPDVIIVLNSTGSLRVDEIFPYLPTAAGPSPEPNRPGNRTTD